MDAMMSPSGPLLRQDDPKRSPEDALFRLSRFLQSSGLGEAEAAQIAGGIVNDAAAQQQAGAAPDLTPAALERAAEWRSKRLAEISASLPAPCDEQTRALLGLSLRGLEMRARAGAALCPGGELARRLARVAWIVPPVVRGEMTVQEFARPPSRVRRLARQVAAFSREAIAMIVGA